MNKGVPSAPKAPDASETLNEPLLSVEAESCMPQAIGVVATDNRPPDEGPVVQQSLSVSCEAKWPSSILVVATLLLWGGIIFLVDFSTSETFKYGVIPVFMGLVVYGFAVWRSEVTTYIYSLDPENMKLADIGDYIETVKDGQDQLGVIVECYHYRRESHHHRRHGHGHGHGHGHRDDVSTSRSSSTHKTVSFRQEFQWLNGSVHDRSPISRESTKAFESSRAYVEFITMIRYDFTPEAQRDFNAFYGGLHMEYCHRDDHIDLTKKNTNNASKDKILVKVDGNDDCVQEFMMSRAGHFLFVVTGLFLVYSVYFDQHTSECKLPFVKSVHYNPTDPSSGLNHYHIVTQAAHAVSDIA